MSERCPLCYSQQTRLYCQTKAAAYFHCAQCDLVFLPSRFHLSDKDEKSRYDAHQNNPQDAQYRQFLSQVYHPVIAFIDAQAKGLDFGCGPGPTLSVMFEEQIIRLICLINSMQTIQRFLIVRMILSRPLK